MKARASILILFILALGLASCTDPETREQKFADMERLAEQGAPSAQYNLGLMYEQGYGVTPDIKIAAAWFEKAAIRGQVDAQYRLGYLYYHGQGVPKNLPQAAEWYKKAAEQGSALARAALGNMYLVGEGVPKDIAKAAYWHKKSLQLKKQVDFIRD
ncbi:MAG: tetratricopeptide repeat protein [Desulfobaccales bacterium]